MSGANGTEKAAEAGAGAAVFCQLAAVRNRAGSLRGAHSWAWQLETLGHTVKPMALHFVKPYVKSNQPDAVDAEAICEAVGQSTMWFVTRETGDPQAGDYLCVSGVF